MLKDRIIRANDLRENRQTTEVRRNWLSLFVNKTWRAVLKMFSRLYKIAASEALPPPTKKKKKEILHEQTYVTCRCCAQKSTDSFLRCIGLAINKRRHF